MSNSFTQSFGRVLLMGLILQFVGGCAAKKILIKNADGLLEYQVEKRIPLYSAQKKELSRDLANFLNQKRAEAQMLFPIIDEINIDDADKIPLQYRKIASLYEEISLSFTALLANYLTDLDKKQQKDFFENLADENRQMAKKDPDERLEKMHDRFKTFFGAIDSEQKQLLTDLQDTLEANNKAKLARRSDLLEKLRAIYAQELSSDSRRSEIIETFKSYQKAAYDHDKNIQMLKKILPTLSKEQREFFRKKVAEVKEILKLYLETEY